MIALLILAGLFDALQQADSRVATIAWRLQTANVGLCRDTAPLAGFSIQTLDQFQPDMRVAATAALGLGDLPQVSAVVPGSAAAHAGIEAGDTIRAIDDVAMPRARGGAARYDASAVVEAALTAALAHPPARLDLASRQIALTGDIGCVSQVQLIPESRFDATADSRYVQISGPMYAFAGNDDALAFVIAHELAHNLFPEARRSLRGGKAQRTAETAADRMAVWMMARAGYDVDAVAPLLTRLNEKQTQVWRDTSHPAWKQRIIAVGQAVMLVKEQRVAGLSLIPLR